MTLRNMVRNGGVGNCSECIVVENSGSYETTEKKGKWSS